MIRVGASTDGQNSKIVVDNTSYLLPRQSSYPKYTETGDKQAKPVWTPQAPRRGDERSEESTRSTGAEGEVPQAPSNRSVASHEDK